MVTIPVQAPYEKHTQNHRSVKRGLTQAERAHKTAIGGGNTVAVEFAARVHHMMVGLLAEASLRKIAWEPGGFNDRERTLLSQERTQLSRWTRAVELGFRRHYAVPVHLDIDANSVGSTVASRYATVIDLLNGDLAEVIEDRNKLAHGQWAWVLNSKETDFVRAAAPPLNYRAIETRSKIVGCLAALIQDLTISEPTFQRDYETHYEEIEKLRTRLAGPDYADLVAQLQARRR